MWYYQKRNWQTGMPLTPHGSDLGTPSSVLGASHCALYYISTDPKPGHSHAEAGKVLEGQMHSCRQSRVGGQM